MLLARDENSDLELESKTPIVQSIPVQKEREHSKILSLWFCYQLLLSIPSFYFAISERDNECQQEVLLLSTWLFTLALAKTLFVAINFRFVFVKPPLSHFASQVIYYSISIDFLFSAVWAIPGFVSIISTQNFDCWPNGRGLIITTLLDVIIILPGQLPLFSRLFKTFVVLRSREERESI